MSDNHPADLLGCGGNTEIHTPHIDRLAAEGLRFENAFSVNAMCSPCRASVLTGLMPSQHGIHTWLDDRQMDSWPEHWNALAGLPVLPELLQEQGYQTALIGKYHLGRPDRAQNGFDHWVTLPHGHTRSFWGNTLIENGQRSIYEGHSVDAFTEKAVEYLDRHDPAQGPFFMFLSYNGPYGHWPAIQGPARNRFASRYADTEMRSVPREGLSPAAIKNAWLRQQESGGGLDYSSHLRIPNDLESLRNYFSQMSMVDDGVGQVVQAVDEAGLAEDTLVIYTCDHGFSLGSHGYWGHGQATWPANAHRQAYHIPLIFRQPGAILPGQVEPEPVSQIDLFSTMLELGGAEPPDSSDSFSRSLMSCLEGQALEAGQTVFIEQEELRAIRTAQWLYVKRFAGHPTEVFENELFDLSTDPDERHNRIDAPQYADQAAALDLRLEAYFSACSDPRFDLWAGGRAKGNASKPAYWKSIWGVDWAPVFDLTL